MKRSAPDGPSKRPQYRLMIHAIDGCVPFLSPDMLEEHFPPSDDLWIGMAVRDTCVVPTYQEKQKKTKTKNKQANNGNTTVDKAPPPTNASQSKKPRGYTFEALPADSWLEPYSRVTVPSFDWMHDNRRKKVERSQQKAGNSTATNQHVLVWTPHGRQKLTPEIYARGSSGLKSHYTVSLYDMYEDSSDRRREKANTRNKEWFQDLLTRRSEPSSSDDSLWAPIVIPEDVTKNQLVLSHESAEDVAGVALIGQWQKGLETAISKALTDQVPHVAILATFSLLEVLQILASKVVDTIGTDLPTRWTKDRLALVVDFSGTSSPASKRQKSDDPSNTEHTSSPSLDSDGCIDLSNKMHARDAGPLVPGCQCLACANNKFSRAYIHHLICAKELLADMILFAHNLHYLLSMVRAFNLTEDVQALVDSISSHLPSSLGVAKS